MANMAIIWVCEDMFHKVHVYLKKLGNYFQYQIKLHP